MEADHKARAAAASWHMRVQRPRTPVSPLRRGPMPKFVPTDARSMHDAAPLKMWSLNRHTERIPRAH